MRISLHMAGLVLAVAAVALVRTFGFEYFHGDPAPLHGLMRAVGIS
jgi:hypothetical protein